MTTEGTSLSAAHVLPPAQKGHPDSPGKAGEGRAKKVKARQERQVAGLQGSGVWLALWL